MDNRPEPDLPALEKAAAKGLADARNQQAAAVAKTPAVERTHRQTQELRRHNQFADIIRAQIQGGR